MSIEALIAANTAALEKHTAALTGLAEALNASFSGKVEAIAGGAIGTATVAELDRAAGDVNLRKPAPTEAPKAAEQPGNASAAAEARTEPSASPASSNTPSAHPANGDSEVTLETLQGTITAKAKAHRAEVVAILAEFGAKRGSEVKAEDRAACNAKMAAIGA